jgi:putative peptide-modifying radical SAM enzyme
MVSGSRHSDLFVPWVFYRFRKATLPGIYRGRALTPSSDSMYYHLLLTDDCNLCCSYCRARAFEEPDECGYVPREEEFDPNLPPDLDLDPGDLYRFLSKDPDAVLTFYGGEPLLRTDLIEEIMDNAPVERFMIQTNGILLNTVKSRIVNRFSTILISVDGPQEITDINRGAGTYRAVMNNVRLIRERGYENELIARMTVTEKTDIFEAVRYLSDNPDYSFSSIHWQLDADFSGDLKTRRFAEWASESYNPGIRRLARFWVSVMRSEGRVLRWYPFIDPMEDLLLGRKTRLRCGGGYANYAIMTDGHIAPCPIMVGMVRYYCGHIKDAAPSHLSEVAIGGPCLDCGIRDFCGGRCLYSNIIRPWGEDGRRLTCGTVENLHAALTEVLPDVKELIQKGKISMDDFSHEKFNGCEIIP